MSTVDKCGHEGGSISAMVNVYKLYRCTNLCDSYSCLTLPCSEMTNVCSGGKMQNASLLLSEPSYFLILVSDDRATVLKFDHIKKGVWKKSTWGTGVKNARIVWTSFMDDLLVRSHHNLPISSDKRSERLNENDFFRLRKANLQISQVQLNLSSSIESNYLGLWTKNYLN